MKSSLKPEAFSFFQEKNPVDKRNMVLVRFSSTALLTESEEVLEDLRD